MNKKKLKARSNLMLFCWIVMLISLFIGGYGLLVSVETYYKGFHNVDLAVNGMLLQEKVGMTFLDLGSDFKTRTLAEYYIIGQGQMENGFIYGALSSALIALSFGLFLSYFQDYMSIVNSLKYESRFVRKSK